MAPLSEHPTVKRFWERTSSATAKNGPQLLEAQWLRQLCLEAGADDAGFVDIGRAGLGDERADILRFFPHTKALISFVLRMNREPVRSPARSVANLVWALLTRKIRLKGSPRLLLAFGKCFPS